MNCIYIRQAEPLGLGHAVGCAASVVDDEPFAVILADDLIDGKPGALKQMIEAAHRHGGSVLGVEEVPRAETRKYGIVSSTRIDERTEKLTAIVEKPAPEVAPSTLAVVGRYVLTPKVFELIASVKAGAVGEIQLTDAISALLAYEPVFAYRFEGTRYDCGSKLGYLKASVALGLKHKEVGKAFAEYLQSRTAK